MDTPNAEPAPASYAETLPPARRPHGGNVMTAGWVLIAGGFLAGFLGAMIDPVSSYGGEIDPDKLRQKALFFWGAAAALSAGTLLALAGYIVRAIWFLPGDDEKPVP